MSLLPRFGRVSFPSYSFIKGCVCTCVCVFTSWLQRSPGDSPLQLFLYKTVTSNTHRHTHTLHHGWTYLYSNPPAPLTSRSNEFSSALRSFPTRASSLLLSLPRSEPPLEALACFNVCTVKSDHLTGGCDVCLKTNTWVGFCQDRQ